MGRKANPHKEHNIRIEKTVKLWNKLVEYHEFLTKSEIDNFHIEKFWKIFKPLLPPRWKSKIPKNNLKKISFKKMEIVKPIY